MPIGELDGNIEAEPKKEESPMLTERAIAAFLALAETLNYTEAARRLYMTHQALSKQIARLEETLNHRLFVRSTRSVQLTAVVGR